MIVKMIASSVGDGPSHQYLTSYLVNRALAVDAGGIGLENGPEEQARIRHVLISHAHADHIASLPILVDNLFNIGGEGLTILASQDVLDALNAHVFNDVIWPDLVRRSAGSIRFQPFPDGSTLALGALAVTAVPVDHVVPTQAFIVAEPGAAVAFVSDTCPTEEVWRVANDTPDLKAVFLEAAFPDEMRGLADASKHLTPSMFAGEIAKLRHRPRIMAVHVKARFEAAILDQLARLGLPGVEIAQPGVEYTF